MTTQSVSLWPTDFGEQTDVLTPLAILRQQGALLGEQTRNIVVGRVSTFPEGETFVQRFSIYCPPLGYETILFDVKHGIDLYPATVVFSESGLNRTVAGEEELQANLKEVFARPKTKKIVASLLAQSRE